MKAHYGDIGIVNIIRQRLKDIYIFLFLFLFFFLTILILSTILTLLTILTSLLTLLAIQSLTITNQSINFNLNSHKHFYSVEKKN